jgi:hypothetical protein
MLPKIKEFREHHRNGRIRALVLLGTSREEWESDPDRSGQSRAKALMESFLEKGESHPEWDNRTKKEVLTEIFRKKEERGNDPAMVHAFLVLEVTLFGLYPLHNKDSWANMPLWTPLDNEFDVKNICEKFLGLEIPREKRSINSVEVDDIFIRRANELLSQRKTDG